ncbi:hypothetical protein DSO57_1005340 [Entomophthora muscae]|uniref:Uncharacterized protein n=1 Tax=Entomophthora muscae TaxID=34485 RepID=A0ACC2RMY8_9FUNG|nr:hypothetical protein DSO57_1005340 [Entomophthora muscae]
MSALCPTTENTQHGYSGLTQYNVATESPDFPANISHNTQGTLDELSLDMSNGMNQSDDNVKLQALSPN